VLIRAIEPTVGLETMRARRPVVKLRDLSNGPGKLCAAMDIDRRLDGVDLCDTESPIFVAENPDLKETLKKYGPMVTTTRIGITQAAHMPFRFYLAGSHFVSKRAVGLA
jgi:DNA-3-methyladenine glycosylase